MMCLKTEESLSGSRKSSQRERIFWSDDASQTGGTPYLYLTGWCAQISVVLGRCKVDKLWESKFTRVQLHRRAATAITHCA